MSSITNVSSVSGLFDSLSSASVSSAEELEKLEETLEKKYEEMMQQKLAKQTSGSSANALTYGQTIEAAADAMNENITDLITGAKKADVSVIARTLSDFSGNLQILNKNITSAGDGGYLAMQNAISALFASCEDALLAMGISVSSAGAVTVDDEVLANAQPEELEELFGEKSELTKKLKEYADCLATVASMNASSYRARQTMYSSDALLSGNTTQSLLDAFS